MARMREKAPETVYRTTTVKLPRELHKRLRMASVEREQTASEIIEAALEVELKRRK